MKNYLIYSAIGLALYYWLKKNGAKQDLGNGWVVRADGTAVGPDGATAMYTGYQSGDPYPADGNAAIF